jgi:protein gp37
MAETTKIEWTDATFNPWMGCTRVSLGCDHCYAATATPIRTMGITWGPGEDRKRTSAGNWDQPLRWNAQHAEFFARTGRRRRVFCASLADVFDNEVPAEWRADLFRVIALTPHLDWLLLTKRIGNAAAMIDAAMRAIGDVAWAREPWRNVWLGATIVNQEEADRDIPKLLATPAHLHFLSMEPLLGPVSLHRFMGQGFGPAPSWVIVGGESGPGARPMHPEWARSLRDQCAAVDVSFLFKQWGEFAPTEIAIGEYLAPDPTREGERIAGPGGQLTSCPDGDRFTVMRRVGKKAAGRLLDGVEHNGFPGVRHA